MKTISVFFTFLFILMILVPVMPIGTHPTNNQKFEETRFPAAIEELEKCGFFVNTKL
jgi:hypothetical protein